MNKKVIVAPSLLAADFTNLAREVEALRQNGITFLHFDVMDGHFVPNLSFGVPILSALKAQYDFVYDVHLMITNPREMSAHFIDAGADIITFHYEVFSNDEQIFEMINYLKSHNVKAGISVKPNTPVAVIEPFLPYLDLVLVMSVEPGFGGQKFMHSALPKLAWLQKVAEENSFNYLIEVDGGINDETGALCKEAGANVLVAGSYLFGKADQAARIKGLKNA